jgi:predicted NBD/HSP70 family sugar kinase
VELEESARELARTVLVDGPLSRSELAARLGLSMASLSRLGKPLIDAGLLVEGPLVNDGTVGRPVRLLDVRQESQQYIGVKITGDEVAAVLTDMRAEQLQAAEIRLESRSLEGVVAAVRKAVQTLTNSGSVAVSGVGISIGGNVDAAGTVLRAPFLDWRNVPLQPALEQELQLPVVMENDVVALTVAEQWFGAGRGVENFALITIGAGVGYGLVIHNRVISVPDTGLGLGGHYPLDPAGPLCAAGHRGCSSALLSISSICSQTALALGRPVEYQDVLALAAEGHPAASYVVRAAGNGLGRMIAAVANLAMVNTVVLAGEGVGILPLIDEPMRLALAADRDPDAQPVEIRLESVGFNQWARGAAAVAIQRSVAGWRTGGQRHGPAALARRLALFNCAFQLAAVQMEVFSSAARGLGRTCCRRALTCPPAWCLGENLPLLVHW